MNNIQAQAQAEQAVDKIKQGLHLWTCKTFNPALSQYLVNWCNEQAGVDFIELARIKVSDAVINGRATIEYKPENYFRGEDELLFTIIYDKKKSIKSITINGSVLFYLCEAAFKEVAHQKEIEEQERMASEALQAAQREERLKEYKPFNEIIMDMQHGDRALKWAEEAEQEGKIGFMRVHDEYKYFQNLITGPLKLSSVFVNGLYKLEPKLHSAYRALEALEDGHTVRYYKEGSSSLYVEISPEDYLGSLATELADMQVKDLLAERWSIIYKTEE